MNRTGDRRDQGKHFTPLQIKKGVKERELRVTGF